MSQDNKNHLSHFTAWILSNVRRRTGAHQWHHQQVTPFPWCPAASGVAMGDELYPECRAQEIFDEFVSASTCRAALRSFSQLCEHLQLDPSTAERPLYQPIKRRLNYWRANALWAKLDRRAAQQEYLRARACSNTTVCPSFKNFIYNKQVYTLLFRCFRP